MMFRYLISPRFGGVKAFGGNLVSTTSPDFALLKTPFNQKCLHKSTIVVRQMSIKSKQQQHQNTSSTQPSLATFPSNENKKGFYSGKSFTDWRVGLLTVGGTAITAFFVVKTIQDKSSSPPTSILDLQLQQKSWSELISLYITFRLCTITPLVKYGNNILQFLSSIGLGSLADVLVENTFFATFCGGEDVIGIVSTGKKLHQEDLGTIVDYAEEEVKFDFNLDMELQRQAVMQRFTESILAASNIAPGSFVALRMTTFCPHDVLKKLSTVIMQEKESIGVSETILDQDLLSNGKMTMWEMETVNKAINCLNQLAQLASKNQVHIMLDAETWETQPAIDQMFLHILRENKEKLDSIQRPTIFQTFQAYTKSCPERLEEAIRFSEANKCPLAIKLVRGAYVEAETKRSIESGMPSPIWPTKEETDRCYNHSLVSFTERIRINLTSSPATINQGPCSIMLATHNEQSAKIGLQERASLAKEDRKRIFFAQLYGMGRELSQKIVEEAKASPSSSIDSVPDVYKYVPYGPLEVVMGYLSRRASENLGMRSLARHEYLAAGREMRRRLISWS